MNILLSNDDGFHAEGIQTLAAHLRTFANVIIVAPDRNRSAASSAWGGTTAMTGTERYGTAPRKTSSSA